MAVFLNDWPGPIPCTNLLLSNSTNDPLLRKILNKCWLRLYNDNIKERLISSSLNTLAVIRSDGEEKLVTILLIAQFSSSRIGLGLLTQYIGLNLYMLNAISWIVISK